MTVAAISDTHGQHRKLHVPDGEVLIVGGDFTDGQFTTREQVKEFDEWMHTLHFTHKVCVHLSTSTCTTTAQARCWRRVWGFWLGRYRTGTSGLLSGEDKAESTAQQSVQG